MLVDTHCHIHDADFPIKAEEAINNAVKNGVNQMICVGTSFENSNLAVDFAKKYSNVFAVVGVHPHEADSGVKDLEKIIINNLDNKKIVAIGEIGLDYHYNHSPKEMQIRILKEQIRLAIKYNLPIVFHVREAFLDFWPIYDEFINQGHTIKGVIHSFTDDMENVKQTIKRGLYIGINGFSTFAKEPQQKLMYKNIPIESVVFETDAPYLTPKPFRGKVNEPAFVRVIAEHNGLIRELSIDVIEKITTSNAKTLFNL